MAIYYVDYLGGSDANAGTSFATRKQTLSSAYGTLPLSAGDEIRIMRGGDPWSIGNCTWISNTSATIILPDNTTQILYRDGAWVGSTNVTASTTTNRKQGASAAQFSIGAAFTTGKFAYIPLSAGGLTNVNLTSYSKISFWIWSDTAINNPMSGVSIRLCSDAFGNDAVETLYWPKFGVNNYSLLESNCWIPITLTNGQYFSAASVNSIAIYHDTDLSTGGIVWRIDNVFATNSIALDTLVSKNSFNSIDWDNNEHWWTIRSVEDKVVAFDMGKNSNHSVLPSKGYYSSSIIPTTATNVATYVLTALPVYPDFPGRTSFPTISAFRRGTINDKISVTGGWDMVDMTTQSGYTWLTPRFGNQQFFNLINSPYGYTFSKLGLQSFSTPLVGTGAISAINVVDCAFVGGVNAFTIATATNDVAQLITIDRLSCVGNGDQNNGAPSPILINSWTTTTGVNAFDYVLKKIFIASCGGGIVANGLNTNCVVDGLTAVNNACGAIHVGRFSYSVGTKFYNLFFDNNWVSTGGNIVGLTLDAGRNNYVENVYISRNNFPGFTGTISNCGIYLGLVNTQSGAAPINTEFKNTYVSRCGHVNSGTASGFVNNGAIGGIILFGACNTRFYNTYVELCSGSIGNNSAIGTVAQGAIAMGNGTNNTFFYNLTSRDNILTSVRTALRYTNGNTGLMQGSYAYIQNYDYNETSPYYTTSLYGNNGSDNTFVTVNNVISGNSTVITKDIGQIRTITTPTYTGAGTAWLMDIQGTARNQGYPLVHNLDNVYVDANTTYTASVYVYRSGGAVVGEFAVDGPQLYGMGTGSVAQTTAASISAWEKLSVTFTPTQAGFVGFTVQAYLSSRSVTDLTKDVIWDQFEITPTVTTAITGGKVSTPYALGGVYLTSSAPGGGSPVVTGGETAYTFC